MLDDILADILSDDSIENENPNQSADLEQIAEKTFKFSPKMTANAEEPRNNEDPNTDEKLEKANLQVEGMHLRKHPRINCFDFLCISRISRNV